MARAITQVRRAVREVSGSWLSLYNIVVTSSFTEILTHKSHNLQASLGQIKSRYVKKLIYAVSLNSQRSLTHAVFPSKYDTQNEIGAKMKLKVRGTSELYVMQYHTH